jgi:hypothetical protein
MYVVFFIKKECAVWTDELAALSDLGCVEMPDC